MIVCRYSSVFIITLDLLGKNTSKTQIVFPLFYTNCNSIVAKIKKEPLSSSSAPIT